MTGRYRCIAVDNSQCAYASPTERETLESLIPTNADFERIGHDGRWLYLDADCESVVLQIPAAHVLLQVEFSSEEIRDLLDALKTFGFVREGLP